jgi:hypothetical protein
MPRMKSFWMPALLFVLSIHVCAQNTRRDGNWWLEQSELSRTAYVTGFFDGTHLGGQFSFWNFTDDKACLSKATESFTFYSEKFLKDVTNGQLADGLDVFYKDYRNRKILIHNAVWLTLNAIAGTPQADLDKMVENFRKHAVD